VFEVAGSLVVVCALVGVVRSTSVQQIDDEAIEPSV